MTTARIISRVTGMPWLIQAEALQTIIEDCRPGPAGSGDDRRLEERASRPPLPRAGDPLGNSPGAGARRRCHYPDRRPDLRYANLFTEFSGATALSISPPTSPPPAPTAGCAASCWRSTAPAAM